jgi:Protein of unknown function (DUF4238)
VGSKQTIKRCHWVPQVYLRAFAADPDRLKIWRFSKEAGAADLKSIEKVAVRFHLYVPRDSEGRRDDTFERKLAGLEQWFGSPIWRVLRDDVVDLSWEPLRKMVSLLAATMFLRNPSHFAAMRNMHARFAELSSSPDRPLSFVGISGEAFPLDSSDWSAFREATEDDLKRLWIAEINGGAYYAEKFMTMRWSVVCADDPVFITTDNPVVFLHPSLTFRGINNPETRVIFPISPTRVLCMDYLHREPANCYYPLKGTAAPQNLLMWRNSLEYMFSHRHPNVVCAELVQEAEQQGFA